jgi:hypothetical protein
MSILLGGGPAWLGLERQHTRPVLTPLITHRQQSMDRGNEPTSREALIVAVRNTIREMEPFIYSAWDCSFSGRAPMAERPRAV